MPKAELLPVTYDPDRLHMWADENFRRIVDAHNQLDTNVAGLSVPVTLGYAERTTDYLGFSAASDVPGLSVTVTVPAARRIRVTAFSAAFYNPSVANAFAEMDIYQDGIRVQLVQQVLNTTGSQAGKSISWVGTPAAGTHTYKVVVLMNTGTGNMAGSATYPSYILVEDITGSSQAYTAASIPVGQLAYAPAVAQQGGIVTETALTGLSVNVVVPAGRTLRISGHAMFYSTVANDSARISLKEGANLLQIAQDSTPGVTQSISLDFDYIVSPTAGAHTYNMTMQRTSGSGTLTMDAGAVYPAFLLVEDITPTPAASSGAPGSTLGYAEWTTNQTGITAEVALTGLTVTVTVPAGRRIRVTGSTYVQNTGANNINALRIYQDGVQVTERGMSAGAANVAEALIAQAVVAPAAGSHTFALRLVTGAGTAISVASATLPAFILVEDITGALWPTGSPISAGMVASEQWTDYIPTLKQGATADIAKTVLYSRYIKIGRMVTWQFRLSVTGTGTASAAVQMTLPFAPVNVSDSIRVPVGVAQLLDTSVNTFYPILPTLALYGSPDILFTNSDITGGVGNQFTGLSGFTAALANGDNLAGTLTYESAA